MSLISRNRFRHWWDFLLVQKYNYTGIVLFFAFYVDYFCPLSPTRHLSDFILYEWHGGCLIKNMNCLSFASTWFHPCFSSVESVLLIFIFSCVLFVSLFVFFFPFRVLYACPNIGCVSGLFSNLLPVRSVLILECW